jgi:hypothetical protein
MKFAFVLTLSAALFAAELHAEDAKPFLLDTQKPMVVSEAGKITSGTDYDDLQDMKYTPLWDGALLYYEQGICRLATLAHRGSPKEFAIFWKGSPEHACYTKADYKWRSFDAPELIRINRPDSVWQTEQGIRVGTTLEELEAIHGGSIGFIGMGWDMGGACCMGKFSKHVGFTLAAEQSVVEGKSAASKYYAEHLVGDRRVESKDIPTDIKKKLNIKVTEIFLNF